MTAIHLSPKSNTLFTSVLEKTIHLIGSLCSEAKKSARLTGDRGMSLHPNPIVNRFSRRISRMDQCPIFQIRRCFQQKHHVFCSCALPIAEMRTSLDHLHTGYPCLRSGTFRIKAECV